MDPAMDESNGNASPPSADDALAIRKLAHDMRSSLSILSMGLQLLAETRESPQEFNELCEMMQTRGIDTLAEHIDILANLYRRPQP